MFIEQQTANYSREQLLIKAQEKQKLAISLNQKADYQTAVKVGKEAVTIFKQLQLWQSLIRVRCTVGEALAELAQVEATEIYLHQTLKIGLKHLSKQDLLLAEIYSILGYFYNYTCQDPLSADPFLQKSLAIRRTHKNAFSLVADSMSEIGYSYSLKADYTNALKYMQQALAIYEELGSTNKEAIAANLNNISRCHVSKKDYDSALLFYQKSLSIFQSLYPNTHPYIATIYENMGTCHYSLSASSQALSYFEQALQINKTIFGEIHPTVAKTYVSIGNAFAQKKDYQKSLHYFAKALDIQQQTRGKNHLSVAMTTAAIARIYKQMQLVDKAIIFYQKSIHILEKNKNNKQVSIARYATQIAYCFAYKKKDFTNAFTYLHQAHQALYKVPVSADIYASIPCVHSSLSDLALADVLHAKINILFDYYCQDTTCQNSLQTAYALFRQLYQLLENTQKNYYFEKSKLYLSTKLFPIYETGIKIALATNQFNNLPQPLKQAFAYSEKTKANLLLFSQQNTLAKAASKISKPLLTQERELQITITFLKKSIQQQKTKGVRKNEALIEKWQNDLFDAHQKYSQLLHQIETNYPDYYQLKHETQAANIETLQSYLTKNQVLVSYFVGKTTLYIFTISHNEFEVEELQKPSNFKAQVNSFLNAINTHSQEEYIRLARQLYQLLLAPIEMCLEDSMAALLGKTSNKTRQLIIIPHAELTYLPFEALLRSSSIESNYGNLDYLLHHYEISYHYSATLWLYQQQKDSLQYEQAHSFAGFAPIYDNAPNATGSNSQKALKATAESYKAWATRSEALRSDGTFVSLPYSESEVKSIEQLFKKNGLEAVTYLREQATKKDFAKAAKGAKYLLIAAHGLVNDEQTALSGLVFYPEKEASKSLSTKIQTSFQEAILPKEKVRSTTLKNQTTKKLSNQETKEPIDSILSMEETYHLGIQADLVVLSSCESGIGKLVKGEGMMAVNRGFLYAGAKNVISTLFKVYDKPSSLLTQYLFEYILKGDSYASALRKAKLRLMQSEGVNPKSWCGFVLIGG